MGAGDPTDGRNAYEWRTKYSPEAWPRIYCEAIFIAGVLIISLVLILVTWKGFFGWALGCTPAEAAALKKYCYYAFSGLLGGSVFGVKYLYRVVARGYWHFDRQLWRYLSPLVAMGVAFAVGTLVDASYFSMKSGASHSATIGVGFLVGYFSDQAVAKLHEIANAIFGTVASPRGK
jgi:hypothetical protein